MKDLTFHADATTFKVLNTLTAMLDWQVQTNPEGVGVATDDTTLTFEELRRYAMQIATAIAANNDTCVGLYCDPSADLICGAWGILYSGQAYLPLAPEYPQERIRYIIENSGTKTIVTQPHLHAQLAALAPEGTKIITIGSETTRSEKTNVIGLHAGTSSPAQNDLAYVIYTSGSTGKPKGVMIEHRSVAAQMQWLAESGYLTQNDRVLQKTPMSFDAAQWEILAPAVGATVVAGQPNLFRDPIALIRKIRTQQVTTLQCVPTLLQALVDNDDLRRCTSLSSVFSGGEALSRKLAAGFFEAMPGSRLINLYGPTECTINATSHLVTPDDVAQDTRSISIGKAVSGATCYILDDDLRPVANGEEGELYIGGVQVARGYVARPEQTAERFITSPLLPDERLYKTGDICIQRSDGTIMFAGRADTQVKLRGYRVELEEISLAIESHPWVRHASAVVTRDPRSNCQVLNACVEMNDKEAAVMDQGVAEAHHQSKSNKLQVKAQLSSPGLRDASQDEAKRFVTLPGAKETEAQREAVFARKTYRFYEGGEAGQDAVQALLDEWQGAPTAAQPVDEMDIQTLGTVLRWFGRFSSEERLLPKFAYASPGALYATQLYVETYGLDGVSDGIHYFNPHRHGLLAVSETTTLSQSGIRLHFAGKKSAIEPVYKNNIQEVLEMETGHMLGVFEAVLGNIGHGIRPAGHMTSVLPMLDMAEDDYYLGAFDCVSGGANWRPDVDVLVQPAGVGANGLESATYSLEAGGLKKISDQILQRKHVIAINQAVYGRAALGVSVISRESEEWLKYIALGWAMHRFQINTAGFGFMSAGYSSKTGNPLPAAVQLDQILQTSGREAGPSYFFVGGLIDEAQRLSQGMNEDAVHMQGPAEMIKEELARSLPDYMIPSRVIVFDKLPLTANGKVDRKAVEISDRFKEATQTTKFIAPQTPTETLLAEIWAKLLKYEQVSRDDDFFAAGGNSLTAISSLSLINDEFGLSLPVQAIFETPRLCDLASKIDAGAREDYSRFISMNNNKAGRPIFCWPGLGGYPMNLRPLAQSLPTDRAFFGIQAQGINSGEAPFETITEMACADADEIERITPTGPVTLWGYSFGARVAFETAWQLQQRGRDVDQLVLICPGNPKVAGTSEDITRREANLNCRSYAAILLSVFLGGVDLGDTDLFLTGPRTIESLADFVHARRPTLDRAMIHRIACIVGQTYEFKYNFRELTDRKISAPITIIKAAGDDYSFIENADGFADQAPRVVASDIDHYEILKGTEAGNLACLIDKIAPTCTRLTNAQISKAS